jgi:hypothetical protein
MRQNWRDIPELINYFNNLEVLVSFNTVYDPPDCALWNLGSLEIQEILNTLSGTNLPETNAVERHNKNKFHGLIRQITAWHNESYEKKRNDFKVCIV